MKVDKELVDRLSTLAKLDFTAKEAEIIRNELQTILGFVEKLNTVNTEGVEPLIYMTEEHNVWRDDVPEQEITHEEALKNAPQKDSDYIQVPKVLRKE
jgi:aspartyl-tRNA(Asn)/glutamyl-tRNA(Gln) amidotransferase subunit C